MLDEKNITDRIELICDGVNAWLANEDGILEESVNRTVADGLFPKHDVQHMLDQAGRTITPQALSSWVDKISTTKKGPSGPENFTNNAEYSRAGTDETAFPNPDQKVLCLHAGNLPMVGLQDIIATLLSGSIYFGKLSRNDPWLLDGLLQVLEKRLPEQIGGWSIRLDDMNVTNAGVVLFAGSQASIEMVLKRIKELGLAGDNSRILARTARFSLAWLDEADFRSDSERLCKRLIEAMLRYEGRGCRSVAVVIADRDLSVFAGSLLDAADVFIRSNPPSNLKNSGVGYWKSYLRSTGRDVFDLGGQIITDDSDLIGKQNVICWIKGSDEEVIRFAERFGHQLQSVYVNAARDAVSEKAMYRMAGTGGVRLEPLSDAQTPPVDWQPDGVDVLYWLCGF